VSTRSEFLGPISKDCKTFTISGKLEYQACDATTCYPPASIPVKWELQVFPLDRTRAPMNIRHKALLAAAGQKNTTNSGSWSGIVVSSACNADEAMAEAPDCFKNVPGVKLSLFSDTTRAMYDLEPRVSAAAHLGDPVTVRGTLDGDTIQVASIQFMSLGLAVGQKAPPFSVRDQFGRLQTLDTLKGPNGTVLLFFRSADW
jgi:hypothetical protein